jgi:hypothetical protein
VNAGDAGSGDHAARAELRHPFRILVGHRVRFRRSIVSRSALKYDGPCAVTPGPSRIAALSHFRLIKTVLRLARAQRYLAQSLSDVGREIFAPRRGDDLHADRKFFVLCPYRHCDYWHANEGYRLSPALNREVIELGAPFRAKWKRRQITIKAEVWTLDPAGFGAFIAKIPAPAGNWDDPVQERRPGQRLSG